MQGLLRKNENNLTLSCNSAVCHADDVLLLNISRFGVTIYHIEIQIKNTVDTARYASYLDIHLEIVSESQIRKRDYFNLPIVSFSFMCSNIPVAYGLYIAQLIRYMYFRASSSNQASLIESCY